MANNCNASPVTRTCDPTSEIRVCEYVEYINQSTYKTSFQRFRIHYPYLHTRRPPTTTNALKKKHAKSASFSRPYSYLLQLYNLRLYARNLKRRRAY